MMRVVTHCFSGKQGLLRELGERERLRLEGRVRGKGAQVEERRRELHHSGGVTCVLV